MFDLDGTLADTSGDLIAAANVCLAEIGVALLDPVTDARTALRGGRAMLRLGLGRAGPVDEDLVDRWYQPLLEAYGGALDVHTKMFPGAMAAVVRLTDAGYVVGVCTNKPEGLAQELLVRLGVRDAFGALVGADTLPVRKPDPEHFYETVRRAGGDARRGLLVGDTETDHLTARAAGVPSVLVSFGPEGAGITRLGPDAVLDHYDGLDGIVARLIG